jgi:hypothetical protein
MKSATERTREFRAVRKSGAIAERQISLWLPVADVAILDSLAARACSSRRAVLVSLLRGAAR